MKFRRLQACVAAGVLLLSTSGASAASAASDMVSVNIVQPKVESKWGYAPGTERVQPGSWITWSNAGADPHTVTAVDGSFDSGNLDPSEGFSWFFADPGTFPYLCTLHPWMAGKVIVGDGIALDSAPAADPTSTSDQPPAADQTPAASP